jgi:hypothetical protein
MGGRGQVVQCSGDLAAITNATRKATEELTSAHRHTDRSVILSMVDLSWRSCPGR